MPSNDLYIGRGKLDELIALKDNTGYDVLVLDDELTPSQQRNLEDALGVKVIDRAALILDIFARRARTHEGRLQVELAQHLGLARGAAEVRRVRQRGEVARVRALEVVAELGQAVAVRGGP